MTGPEAPRRTDIVASDAVKTTTVRVRHIEACFIGNAKAVKRLTAIATRNSGCAWPRAGTTACTTILFKVPLTVGYGSNGYG